MIDRVHTWAPTGVCCTSAPMQTRKCARCGRGKYHPQHHITHIAPPMRGPRIDWGRLFAAKP